MYTDAHGHEILSSEDLDIQGSQFGFKFKPGGAPEGLIDMYTEDDENWFYVTTFNHFWLNDLKNIVDKAKEHFRV